MTTLARHLFRALLDPSRIDDHRLAAVVDEADESEWRRSMLVLRSHRLNPAAWAMLTRHGLQDRLRHAVREDLSQAYRASALTNRFRMNRFDAVLAGLAEKGLSPVAFKGIALANTVYDDIGARPMGDIDCLIAPEDAEAVAAVLAAHGFHERERQAHATYYEAPGGLQFDVHHTFDLFRDRDIPAMCVPVRPRFMTAPALQVFEPNASLVQLVCHVMGHRRSTGLVLLWLLDIARTAEQGCAQLAADRLNDLLPDDEARRLFTRILRFVYGEAEREPPPYLEAMGPAYTPLTWDEVLRTRRLAAWGLPRLKGWARVGARLLGLRTYPDRPLPEPRDCALWMLDAWRG